MIGVICEAFARTSGATGKAGEGTPEKVSARGKMEKDALALGNRRTMSGRQLRPNTYADFGRVST